MTRRILTLVNLMLAAVTLGLLIDSVAGTSVGGSPAAQAQTTQQGTILTTTTRPSSTSSSVTLPSTSTTARRSSTTTAAPTTSAVTAPPTSFAVTPTFRTLPPTTTTSTTSTTIAGIGGRLPVSPSTLPLATKGANAHVSPVLAMLSGIGFFVALVIMAGRFFVSRPRRTS